MKLYNFIRVISVFVLASLAALSSGCVATSLTQNGYDDYMAAGDYPGAASSAEDSASGEDLLGSLHYASALRCCKEYEMCIDYFDKAEALYKAIEEDSELHAVEKNAAAALVNETITSYTGHVYEMTLVNAYKSMAFSRLGDTSNARVEINRALDRQRRAKEFFSDEIGREMEKAEQTDAKRNQEAQDKKADKTAENENNQPQAPVFVSVIETTKSPELTKALKEKYSNLENFEPLADYTNPFVTYYAGLFFLLDKDYAKAVDLLKEAAAMCSENTIIQEDYKLAQTMVASINPARLASAGDSGVVPANGKAKAGMTKVAVHEPASPRYAWVIFENGSGPGLESLSIPIPLMLVTKKALITQVALPRPVPGVLAMQGLTLTTSAGEVLTEPVVDMDDVINTEFKARFNAILLRAVESAIAKAAMQVVGKQVGGDLGQILAALYGMAVSNADTRHWLSLPARYEVSRVRIDQTDGVVQMSLPTPLPTQVQLDPTRNHLVLVSMRTPASIPYIDAIDFN